uniref:NADH dehydrogenase subunit 6 n=1 Tax=Amblyomma triguttatum TaxID=65637 RepID=Q6I7M1_9ACAR|nr:NADH dehydrogenase subunit 6 [Amblyomma triguttatum]BAD24962.1 NADH dehydrogenase subunit 6 [Amblyomma triguttatum]
MKLILIMAIFLICFNHPMTMLISVILLTLFMSLIFYLNSCNSLFSLILVLLILGGMLMIFLYMVSLCPNMKMNFKKKLGIFIIFPILMEINYIYHKFSFQELTKIFFFMFSNIIIMMMIYLLVTLMVVMKNLNWINTPMKMT